MSLWHKLFRVGSFTEQHREAINTGTVVFAGEGIRCPSRAKQLRAPGRVVSAGIRGHYGALVLTTDWIVASVGRSLIANAPYGAIGTDEPATLSIDEEGVHVVMDDLGRIAPGTRGSLRLDYRCPLSSEILVQLRYRTVPFRPDPTVAMALIRLLT
jgi:hypothetical protein